MTKSGRDLNRVTITNNATKYYSDVAKDYANQAETSVVEVKQVKSDISDLLQNTNFSTVSNNFEKIVTVANNIENLDTKANVSDVYTKSEIDTKLDGIEALLEEI